MSKIEINIGEVQNSCFVAMPFGTLFQTEYEKIIQPALEGINIFCVRGDEIYTKQRIVDDIWESLKSCRFVLAELTGKNPNVMYEIGLAHAIGKPVIIITRNEEDVPFDLKSLRYLFYDVNDPYWGENLKKGIQNLATKVIENPSIESYLQGIVRENVNFPEIITDIIKTKKYRTPSQEIIGTWQGEFPNLLGKIHKVTLQINRTANHFSAAAVITYAPSKNQQTVVQQIMNVNFKDDLIKLNGVNYTYIERGETSEYSLDNFELRYNKLSNELVGVVMSIDDKEKVHSSDVIFKKI